jgi:F-type H+-transporting ATPase subunit gamma
MPSLKAIRTRINSVKNTQKITKAMKLVAAARLRRAQEAIHAQRPYAHALEEMIAEVAARAGHDAHPLLVARPLAKILLVPITSDRGLAGSSNSQINRATERYIYEHKPDHETIQLMTVGRKGRDYLRRRRYDIVRELSGATPTTTHDRAREIQEIVVAAFLEQQYDGIFLVYNEFKSAITQKPIVQQLLPIVPRELPAGASPTDYKYEPSRKDVLDRLLPMYVQTTLFKALLEAVASEFGAKMSAMDSASNNAKDMINRLTIDYNRARQAYITKELLEIIGGAEALKG